MSKPEKQLDFILVNSIVIVGSIFVLLIAYIIYQMLFPSKIIKDIPKNIDGIIEFKIAELNNFEEILGNNSPWFLSYKDKIPEIDKGAILFYKGEKIDVLLTGSERSSVKTLEKISAENSITRSGSIIISNQSPIPPCIQKGNSLFCGKNENLLKEIARDESKIRENPEFIKIENNLYKKPLLFGFIDLKKSEDFKLTREKYDSVGISLKEKDGKIEGIILGNYNKNFDHIKFQNKRILNLEKYINPENLVISFGSREFEKQVKKSLNHYEKNNSYLALLGKGLIQGKLKEIFGESMEIEDLLKVFSGETIFSISRENGKYEFEIISEKTDGNKDLLKKYEENLVRFLPFKEVFQYKNIELTQIASNEENIEKTEEFYSGAKIYGFKAKDQDFGIYFTENKDLIRISSSKERLKKIINKTENNLGNKLPHMPYSNDFGYMNMKNILEIVEKYNMENIKIPSTFKDKDISWSSINFEDGIQVKFLVSNMEISFKNPIEKGKDGESLNSFSGSVNNTNGGINKTSTGSEMSSEGR